MLYIKVQTNLNCNLQQTAAAAAGPQTLH